MPVAIGIAPTNGWRTNIVRRIAMLAGKGDPTMDADDAADLEALKIDVLANLRRYLADMLDGGGDSGYTGADVGECGRILDTYLADVADVERGDEEAVRRAVRDVVLALNALNARCDGGLIGTDQREQLCTLIQRAAATAGVGSGEDVTEAWREW
jgi:hypothetical protein